MRHASALIVVLLFAAPVRADPTTTYAGLKYLDPASGSFAIRPGPAYDLIDEVSKGRNKAAYFFNMIGAGLGRVLGFDLTSRKWLEAAGIDPQAPILGSLPGLDPAKARALNRRLEAAARKHLARKASGESRFDAAVAGGPAPLTVMRLVLTIKDSSKVRPFLDALAAGPIGQRYVKLDGRTNDEVAPSLKTALGCASVEDAVALAAALQSRGVYALVRFDRDLWGLVRLIQDRFALVDLVGSWTRMPEAPDKAFARSLGAQLELPKRPAFDLAKKGLAARVFTDDASAALLLLAKPMLQNAELEQEQWTLRTAAWVKDAASFAKDLKSVRACTASFRQAPSGDLGLQLISSKTALRGKAFWAAPAALTKLIQSSAAKQDLIDPSAWQSKAVAFAGTTLALGPLSAGLGRGPFKGNFEETERKLRDCTRLAPASLLLGGWTGLLGVLHAEGARTPLFKLVLGHLQNGVVLLRELYSMKSPLFLAHVVVSPKLPHAKLKDEVAKLYTETYGKPQELTVAGRTATLYRFLKAPLVGLSGAVTDLKTVGSSITLSSRPWDLQWLLTQIVGDTPTPLPRSVLFFAHANLGTILAVAARESRGAEAAMLKALAERADKLGANLSLKDGLLGADLDLSFK